MRRKGAVCGAALGGSGATCEYKLGAPSKSDRASHWYIRCNNPKTQHRHKCDAPERKCASDPRAASAATSGYLDCKSLKPARTSLFEQKGQPVAREDVRVETVAFHSWQCFAHFHGISLLLPAMTVVGSKSASAARSERVMASSLKPLRTFLLAQ